MFVGSYVQKNKMKETNKKEEKEIDYWKLAGIISIFLVVGLIAGSMICNEKKVSTPIGEIDSLSLEQFKSIIPPGEDILAINIHTNKETILQGGIK